MEDRGGWIEDGSLFYTRFLVRDIHLPLTGDQ